MELVLDAQSKTFFKNVTSGNVLAGQEGKQTPSWSTSGGGQAVQEGEDDDGGGEEGDEDDGTAGTEDMVELQVEQGWGQERQDLEERSRCRPGGQPPPGNYTFAKVLKIVKRPNHQPA